MDLASKSYHPWSLVLRRQSPGRRLLAGFAGEQPSLGRLTAVQLPMNE